MSRRLLVVSHVVHYAEQGRLFAYTPYIREIETWADLFDDVCIIAPVLRGQPPEDTMPIERTNVTATSIPKTGGSHPTAKLRQLALLPRICGRLICELRKSDVVHVRCPGNLGFLGVLLAPIFARRMICKYAGQWGAYPGEATSFRWQRRLLKSRWWKGPVTVYGGEPDDPEHIVPFFTSVMTAAQVQRATRSANRKRFTDAGPLRILFVGRLTASKNVHVLLSALEKLTSDPRPFTCDIVGEGPERAALMRQAEELGISSQVRLHGGQPFDRVLDFYEQSQVLVLASETEGWPKAIAEAMAFGLICVGTERGLVSQMLRDGRGYLVSPGDVHALSQALRAIGTDPHASQQMSQHAAQWASAYSLENLREANRQLMQRWWGKQVLPSNQLETTSV